MGFDTQESIARELVLLANNDYQLYKSRIVPITKNLERKLASKTFNTDLACKLVKYLMDDVAKKYAQHYGNSFSPDNRRLASKIWVDQFVANRQINTLWGLNK